MNLEELSKLYESLHLDDRDGPVVIINKEKTLAGKTKMDLVLIGKVLGNRIVNKDVIEGKVEQVWNTTH